ncbi:MAG: hypothetical protein WKF96_18090 [Solirubrobacteraceae bacterium]
MSFDPAEPKHRRFSVFAEANFPDPRDRELDGFVDTIREGGPAAVKGIVARASEQGRGVLRADAERAASRAVRDCDPDRLRSALVALVLGGLDHNSREALTRMPLIEDAARRLDVTFEHLIEDATDAVGHPGSVTLVQWLARKPQDRTLDAMGYEAVTDAAGFRYRWV